MANKQIGILFGVDGGGKVSGASGQLIATQLNSIASELSNPNKRIKIQIGVNEAETRSLIQKQLNNIAKGLTINIGGTTGGGGSGGKGGLSDLERQARNINTLINKNALGSEAVNKKKFAALDANQWSTYESQLKEVLNLQSKVFETQADGSVKRIGSDSQLTDFINKYQQLKSLLDNVTTAQQKHNHTVNATETQYQKAIDEITRYLQTYQRTLVNTPTQKNQLESLLGQLQNKTWTGDPTQLIGQIRKIQNEARLAGGEVETLWQHFKNTFNNKLFHGGMAALADGLRRLLGQAIKETIRNVIELDAAVVDLQIATGNTREETKQLIREYSDLARELGTTTKEVAQSADTWLRQGYNIEEANELIKQSTMLSKLGQMDAADASTALTSALKGYKLEASEASAVVDRMVAVDMEAAASAGDIATMMAECANSARIAGVDMNTLIGYLTKIKEVTQDGSESVGNFAKTLFARMGNIKAGNLIDPESGETLSDVETVLSGVGIALRSSNNNFRDFDEVLSEVAGKWDTYSNVQKRAIAVAFSGTRQQEKFLVLMENFDDAMELAGVSTNSAGTALDKYANSYLPSVQAATNSFTASFEEFSQALMDSDTVAGVIKLGDGLMRFVTFLTDIKALLPAVVAGFMTWKNVGKLNNQNMPRYAQLQLVA